MPPRSSRPGRSGASRPRDVLVGVLTLLPWLVSGAACTQSTSSDSPSIAGSTVTDSPDTQPPLVVYCAHDQVFSAPILERFTRETGIELEVRHDTEATKSLGLVNRLIREQSAPRCDVFWNNQVLTTTDLLADDLLARYRGSGWRRIPAAYKDPAGRWCGFAARLRVWIVNTRAMPATIESVQAASNATDLSRMAVARPLFGTTLTHYCLLWHADSGSTLKAWHERTRRQGLIEVPGNAMVKNLVARGTCDLGWTDTDDYFVGLDDQHPVAMLPVRLPGGKTICMPNSVSIIRSTSRLAAARQLVDFLLSAETELALARCASRQVPLGTIDLESLPVEVQRLRPLVEDGVDLSDLGESRTACLAWLRNEYQR
jgi:iron(III) transport system substrate-binding protein